MSTCEEKTVAWRQKIQQWKIVTFALMSYSGAKGLVLDTENVFM